MAKQLMVFKKAVVNSVVYEATDPEAAVKTVYVMKHSLPEKPPRKIILTVDLV